MVDTFGNPLTYFGVFLLGLGLNLTPCVYPMLSVTISLFGQQKEDHPLKAFSKAAVFVLGIATMYSTLGVVAALTGELLGAMMQSRWVLLAISLLFFYLALTMFGFFTFQLPSWMLNKIGGKQKANTLGLFLSGLFVGIFAAPCVGPPVIALLTFVGTERDPVLGFSLFFVMSMGLGLPYLFFGTFSSLLHRMPKAGVWLIWIERVFGVVLLSMAIFFGILAINVELLQWWGPLSLGGAGIYLGFLQKSGDDNRMFFWMKRVFGVALILVGVALIYPVKGPSQPWDEFSTETLEQAKQNGDRVIIDFYADWCIPCHELDRYTFSDQRVMEKLDSFVRLKYDLTYPESPETQTIIDEYKILGVPTIIFLNASGQEVEGTRIGGFIPPEEMLGILEHPELVSAESQVILNE